MSDDHDGPRPCIDEHGRYWTSDQVRAIVRETVQSCQDTFREEHDDMLTWVRAQMRKEERRRQLIEKVQGTLYGQLILWLFIGLGYTVWTFASAWWREMMRRLQ